MDDNKLEQEFLDIVDFSLENWQKLLESISQITGFPVKAFDTQGDSIGIPCNETELCLKIKDCSAGESACTKFYRENTAKAVRKGEPSVFTCHANLANIAIPVSVEGKNIITLWMGEYFTTPKSHEVYNDITKKYKVNPKEILGLVKNTRRKNWKEYKKSVVFVNTLANFVISTAYQKNLFQDEAKKLITLCEISSDLTLNLDLHELFGMILNALGVLFDVNSASIMLKDKEETDVFETQSAFGQHRDFLLRYQCDDSVGLIEQVVQTRQLIISDDTFDILQTGFPDGIDSFYAFPLIKGDVVWGILCVFNTDLTENDIRTISCFVNQISLAIENFRLKSQLKERMRYLSNFTLSNILVGEALDPEELCRTILDRGAQLIDAEQGSVMILDEDSQELVIKVAKGISEKIVERFRIKPGEGISGTVGKSGSPILVKDIEKDKRFSKRNRPRYKTRSFLSIPLKLNNRVVGVLNMTDKSTGEVFTEDDLELLTYFAAQAAIALERSKYYEKSEALRKISITDSLTGLLNRHYFQERLTEEIDRAKRHNHKLSLIMLDIDNFKDFNDRYGHLVGDQALKIAAKLARNTVRAIDIVARFGGEEIAIILPETQKEEAGAIAERIRNEIGDASFTVKAGIPNGNLTVSQGLATYPDDADSINDLINNADKALYVAKTSGKNKVVLFKSGENREDH